MLTGLIQQAHKVRFLLDDHSTTILTAVGVGGTVATAILSGRASFRAADIIAKEAEEFNAEGGDLVTREAYPLSKFDKGKLVWKEYLPPVATGVTTIACIIVANQISSKKIAALAVAGGISERALQEYKEKVVEKLGVRQDEKIRDEIAQERVDATPLSGQVIIAGNGDVLCFESLTGRYFTSTVENIKRAENKVNYDIIHFDSCSLSTFFEEIGLPPTDYSDMVGWNVANRMEVKLSTTMSEDKRPCLVVGFNRVPSMDYDKNWT